MSKEMDVYAELDNFVEENEGQVTLTDVAKHFAEYGCKYAQAYPYWISVEDEPYPPKKNKWDTQSEEVLVYCLWCGKPTRLFGKYHYDIHEWEVNGLIKNVTHWMPMPTPPAPRKED